VNDASEYFFGLSYKWPSKLLVVVEPDVIMTLKIACKGDPQSSHEMDRELEKELRDMGYRVSWWGLCGLA
jgi:hypothetical protein